MTATFEAGRSIRLWALRALNSTYGHNRRFQRTYISIQNSSLWVILSEHESGIYLSMQNISDMSTRVGVANFSLFGGVEPDLVFADASDGNGEVVFTRPQTLPWLNGQHDRKWQTYSLPRRLHFESGHRPSYYQRGALDKGPWLFRKCIQKLFHCVKEPFFKIHIQPELLAKLQARSFSQSLVGICSKMGDEI